MGKIVVKDQPSKESGDGVFDEAKKQDQNDQKEQRIVLKTVELGGAAEKKTEKRIEKTPEKVEKAEKKEKLETTIAVSEGGAKAEEGIKSAETAKKQKSTVALGSELVLASTVKPAVTAIAVQDGKTGGTGESAEKPQAMKTAKMAKGAASAKSMSGMVADGASKEGLHEEVRAKAEIKQNGRKVEDESEEDLAAKTPRNSKCKSALIGVAVAIAVAIVGFAGIALFTRTPVENCVVQFESNGGTHVNSTEVVCGAQISRPEDPVKEGFDFKGWKLEGADFRFNNDTVDENIVLVAQWEAQAGVEFVTVKFDSDGGSAVRETQVKRGGMLASLPVVPTKDGYVFEGWYDGEAEFDPLQKINEDLTLKAHWSKAPESTNNGGPNNQQNQGNHNSSRPSSPGSNNEPASPIVCSYKTRDEVAAMNIVVGDRATLLPYQGFTSLSNCQIAYKVGNSSIAKLETATLEGLKAGVTEVSICVSEIADNKELQCVKIPLTVTEKVPEATRVTGVELNSTAITLNVQASRRLEAMVSPENATNKTVNWSSSNRSVAIVSSEGVVQAVGVGTATITVTTVDGNFQVSCRVTVVDPTPPEPTPVHVTGVELNLTEMKFDESTQPVGNLIATVNPTDADNKAVTWASSDPAVATVSESGAVQAVGNGTATITVTTVDGNFQASCTVIVSGFSSGGSGSGSNGGSSSGSSSGTIPETPGEGGSGD